MTRNEQIETAVLQRQAARLVEREVLVCMSSVVSALASGFDGISRNLRDLSDLCEQAYELAVPLSDYEEAAREAGWRTLPDTGNGVIWTRDQSQCDRDNEDEAPTVDSAQEACEFDHIDPYDRDVFEHWAVSSWLADKLEAKGEKVDRDFAGLNVWARTTTGQAISIDSVIEAITKETGYASHPATDAA